MKQWTTWLERARIHAQLLGARRDRNSVRRRAVGEPPPPRAQQEAEGSATPQSAPRRTDPAQNFGAARGRRGLRVPRRNRQPSLLTALAQAEEQNQEAVAKVWWLWRHAFLAAKQREVQLHRGLVHDAADELADALDDGGMMSGSTVPPRTGEVVDP